MAHAFSPRRIFNVEVAAIAAIVLNVALGYHGVPGVTPFLLALSAHRIVRRCPHAVIKHVLDHVVNGPTVGRIESAGCLAGLFALAAALIAYKLKS